MQHDSLTVGLLSRLDAMTAKLGIGANALWSLWLATWWRPWLLIGALAALCLTAIIAAVFSWRRYEASVKKNSYNDGWMMPAIILSCTAVGLFIGVVALCPDAISYSLNHQLYAVDQLRGLIGK